MRTSSTLYPATAARWPPLTTRLALLTMPFDALRYHYANAVAAGALPHSILQSAAVGMGVEAMEQLMLGPLARRR